MSSATFNPYDKKTLECVAWNILLCPTHEGAQRDHSELPDDQQKQVWADLTGQGGDEANGRRQQQQQPMMVGNNDESPELIQYCLIQMETEINKLPPKDKTAYTMALQSSPTYVQNHRFRLKFLRADKFDCQASAKRFVNHFKHKLELFGPDKLGRDIYLEDLDEDDKHSLLLGYLQVLPALDHGNRKVIFYYKAINGCYRRRENLLRSIWYIFNKVTEDESVQKLGVVNVVYNIGGYPEGGVDYEKSRRFSSIIKCSPIRFDSFFVAIDTKAWMGVVETFSLLVSKYLRVRMRAIQGSRIEALYGLTSLGIPIYALPVNDSNEVLVENHHNWLRELQAQERDEQYHHQLRHQQHPQHLLYSQHHHPQQQQQQQQQPVLIEDEDDSEHNITMT